MDSILVVWRTGSKALSLPEIGEWEPTGAVSLKIMKEFVLLLALFICVKHL